MACEFRSNFERPVIGNVSHSFNDHRSELSFHVDAYSLSLLRQFTHATGCQVINTDWLMDVAFCKHDEKYIVTHLRLVRRDHATKPVSARIKVCMMTNKGQSTETENMINLFAKQTNSYVMTHFPYEMASSPDHTFFVKITLTVNGCCTQLMNY